MKKIDFNKTMTFRRAVLMPFQIAPILTVLVWLYDITGLAVAPLNVFATSHFINTMIAVFSKEAHIGDALSAFLCMTGIQLYGYILNPVMQMINQKRQQKNWVAFSHELLPTYAGLELRHIEDSDTMDLIVRIWSESPEIIFPSISEDVKNFAIQAGIVISYVAILLTNAPLTGLIIILASIPVIMVLNEKIGQLLLGYFDDKDQLDNIEKASAGMSGTIDIVMSLLRVVFFRIDVFQDIWSRVWLAALLLYASYFFYRWIGVYTSGVLGRTTNMLLY